MYVRGYLLEQYFLSYAVIVTLLVLELEGTRSLYSLSLGVGGMRKAESGSGV